MKIYEDCYKGELPVHVVMKGETGEDVELLQQFLNWYGDYGLEINGIFNDDTEAAMKDFQNSTGYDDNGVFDALSRYVARYTHKKKKV